MSLQSTPLVLVRSRIVASEGEKSTRARRKCKVDLSLPQVEIATPSDKKKVNLETPQKPEGHHRPFFSVPVKRRLEDEGECSKTKRFKDAHDSRTIPMYKNYQLLGDSQFVRFADKLLDLRVEYTEFLRRIGYCVSGQKIEDLRGRLKRNEFGLHRNVIVLIGTNDIVQGTHYTLMRDSYVRLMRFLKQRCSKIILLTIPPVPKLEKDRNHWETLQNFNKFILEYADDYQVDVVDICSIFVSYCNTVSIDYYEKVYFNSRTDLIHLNEKGFKMLKFLLDLCIFEKRKRVQTEPLSRQLF